jgi:hypothetical protein
LTRRTSWIDHTGELPIIEGTLIRLRVEHLPGDRDPKPVWLWTSATGATAADVDRWWQAFLRRFDLEHTFGCSNRPSAGPHRRSRTPAAHPDPATNTPRPVTTSEKPTNATEPSRTTTTTG